jgi:U6 snRNA-associated Sm-like protein LSm8
MTSQLIEPFLNQAVIVSTLDGKVLTGTLSGLDPQCNLVISKCVERIFSVGEGVTVQEHGLFLLRGDNVATIGDLDDEVDNNVEWGVVRAEPIKSIRW